MRTFDGNLLTIADVEKAAAKGGIFYRIVVGADVLLDWMLDGIPSARITEARADSNGIVLSLDNAPLPDTDAMTPEEWDSWFHGLTAGDRAPDA